MTDANRPKFTYLGHSTIRCDLADGRVVLIDPWVMGNPACPPELHTFDRIDAMLITHSHFDHFGDVVELAKRHSPEAIAASFEICHWLGTQDVSGCAPMNLGGTQSVLDWSVTQVRADHSSALLDGDTLLDGGPASGFIVRTAEGFSFYHAGDTALFGDMELFAELYEPELAFLPIGDLFTMDPRQAAHACRLLGVSQVVPVHWGTFPPLTGTPEQLVEELARLDVDCEVVALQPGDSY